MLERIRRIKRIFSRHINTKEINYKMLQKMMKEKQAILIDVRSKQEYEEGHIIVYCSSGVRSKQAQEILENLGYENVYNLKGGLNNI